MVMKKMCYEDQCKIMEMIGREYKASCVKANMKKLHGSIYDNQRRYDNALEYIDYVDAALRMCDLNTRHIIMHEYLLPSDEKWYLVYYSKSTFYRLKRIALEEFLRCLDL